MSWMVTGEFSDYRAVNYNFKSEFNLNADQAFNPYTWSAPIHWEGFVGNSKVKFTQINNSASGLSDFDFSEFPEELNMAKNSIIEAIDKAMKTMD